MPLNNHRGIAFWAFAAASFFLLAAGPAQGETIHISPSGFIYLPCTINGAHGSCLLDTGAADSRMHRKLASGWPRGLALQVGMFGGWPSFLFAYRAEEYSVLGQKTSVNKLAAANTFPFPEQPSDLLGVVGTDALKDKVLRIDTKAGTADFSSDAEGRCLPFDIVAGSPYLSLEGPGGKPLHAIVDSAAGSSVLHPKLGTLVATTDATGHMSDATGKKTAIRVGRLPIKLWDTTEDIQVVVPDQPKAPDMLDGRPVDLILGLSYLSGRAFTLDYKGRRFCVGK